MTELLIMPVIVIGVILGLYELFLIHADMSFRGSHWFGHGLHAIIFVIIALFITMNTYYFLEVTGLIDSAIPFITNALIIRIIVGVILNLKIHATSSLAKGTLAARGLAEHWTHTLIISTLVVIAPYVWPYLAPIVPVYLGGQA